MAVVQFTVTIFLCCMFSLIFTGQAAAKYQNQLHRWQLLGKIGDSRGIGNTDSYKPWSSFEITKIEIQGLRRIEQQAVLEKIQMKPGLLLTAEIAASDIQKIYRMKNFDSVELRRRSGGEVVILVEEKPVISKITLQGNKEESDDDITEQIKSRKFSIVDVSTLNSDIQAIAKFYEEKGYFLVKVDYEIVEFGEDSVEVIFKIEEYDKVMVKKITFLGNKEIPDEELKGFMMTREESLFSGLSGSGGYKEFDFQGDLERLSYYYKTKGYLQANVGNPVVTISEDKKWIFITIQVNEGPQFTVNDIAFSGDMLFTDDELSDDISLAPEQIYNEEKLRQDIQTLTEKYQDEGYAFVNVLRTLEPVPGENRVNILFSFEKGKIAYFGEVYIKGNDKTRDKVIRRELRVHEGMMFSGSKLRLSKENVNRLGFFEPNSVVFNTVTRKDRDDILDLEITVKERQTGQISLGAGYSTVTKGFLQASIMQNNFRGLGQDLSFNLNVSGIQQTYSIGFTEPYFNDTNWSVGGLIYKTRNIFIQGFDFERSGIDLRLGYLVAEFTRMFITYSIAETRIMGITNPAINPDDENGVASGVELSIIRDKRNNAFEPTAGYFASAALEYVGLGFDMRWVKAEVEGRHYYPVWGDLILRSRVRVSQLFETEADRPVPRTQKFALGGPRSLRGYQIQEVGPSNNFENVQGNIQRFNMGGLSSFLTTVELEHPLVQEAGLKWVVFYDTGNVYEKYIGKDGDFSLVQNYGYGMRWFSPIGILRFEIAHPINRDENTAPNQFYFDIGQLF